MSEAFQVKGGNAAAPFTLKIHRGDGMSLVAMNWRHGKPPKDFVGFAIEYKEPGGEKFFALKNRLAFPGPAGEVDPNRLSTLRSPIQKFRWVHFPRNAEPPGKFTYRVTPVFMNAFGELSSGEAQTAALELRRETYPGKLNVTFTRGFVSSQAFVDRYADEDGSISNLLPPSADEGLSFVASHPKAAEALAWMGFEARHAILELLDKAIADPKAEVRVVAYDLSEPDVVSRLERLGSRLKAIVDDSGTHKKPGSGESQAAKRLRASAGSSHVKRQHLGNLQHNKTIVVDGPKLKAVLCGSTNFSWRGFFVQANNAVIVRGKQAIAPFLAAFDAYWKHGPGAPFGKSPATQWTSLGLDGIRAKVAFSPHAKENALLDAIAEDVRTGTKSCLFYSLAFLYQTSGALREAIEAVTEDEELFVYGISDRKVGGGLDLQKPDGNVAPVFSAALAGDAVPQPFRAEPVGGGGNRMHHKFLVLDFDRPTARVYLGSYNFSHPADRENGENLLLIRDRRVAVAYTIEALRLFDHYHFRVVQQESAEGLRKLQLARPPKAGETAWWEKDWTDPRRIRDRELFA